ncbi:MAG: hypothetical protein VW683_05120, partial [Betaproteobacteria bacterium]
MKLDFKDPRVRSGVSSLFVHLILILLLVVGVEWNRRDPEPIFVEYWAKSPVAEVSKKKDVPTSKVEPKPEP